MRIGVYIASQQKGFWISVARLLAESHEVVIVAQDKNVAALARKQAPDLARELVIVEDLDFRVPEAEAVARAREIEERYGVRMAFYIGHDRGLGKGYIVNADRYPDVGSSWWSHERKLSEMVGRFALAEHILGGLRLDMFLGLQKRVEFSCVARALGVASYSLGPVKLASRFMISDNDFMTNSRYLDRIRELVAESQGDEEPLEPYVQEAGSKLSHSLLAYTWKRTAKDVARQILLAAKRIVRRNVDPDSYRLLGWIPPIIRRKTSHAYFMRHGRKPEELAGFRLVYFPMHLEPEIALQGMSPEFNNSAELIAWVSKSLPADALLVVKEQPYAFGMRSRHYYDMLRRIGNVVLAHPDTKSWPWIEASSLVVTITGTAAIEAVNMGRPVLSYGVHQAVNLLPSVRFADCYATTREAVDDLLSMTQDDPRLARALRCLRKAQLDCSFDMSGFEKTYKSPEPQPELAARFVAGLADFDPRLKPEQA